MFLTLSDAELELPRIGMFSYLHSLVSFHLMIQVQENLLSALLFYAVAYVCMSFQFRAGQKRSFSGLVAALVIGVFSVKLVSIQ